MRLDNIPSIIGLHYVTDDKRLDKLKPWVVSQASFLLLLDFLVKEGYSTVGFEELYQGRVKGKNVILTFDDCATHLFDFAIPELAKRGMKAVFYVNTASFGKYNSWNADNGLPRIDLMDEQGILQLVELGMEVGSHAHNHIMLADVSDEEVVSQLRDSKQILENILQHEVLSVAYPYGSVPLKFNIITPSLGYKYGLSVFTPHNSIYALRRWEYCDGDTKASIRWKLSPAYIKYRMLSDRWTYNIKKITHSAYKLYARMKHAMISCTGGLSYWVMDETLMFLSEENYLLLL